jgi:hypothetical protein
VCNLVYARFFTLLQRNIPDLAASLVRSPDASYSTFPLEDERSPGGFPPWEPATRFGLERDITQLRSTNKRLGESLEWILDVLQNESEAHDQDRLHKRRDEALKSLSYVKDVLLGKVTGIEESRLVHTKEDIASKRRFSVHPSEHIPSRPRSTGSQSVLSPQGTSIGSSRPNLSVPIGRLPARSPNMQRTLVEDSVEQKWETTGDPLGATRL